MKVTLVEFEQPFPHLDFLKAALQRIFGMEIGRHNRIVPVPHAYFSLRRDKWDAGRVLGSLQAEFSGKRAGEFMMLGLFPHDLYANSLNFVFGLAEKGGNNAAISYFRLEPKYYGDRADDALFRGRVLKEAVHEIGHMMGLGHCASKKCVMSFSPNILFVDRKTAEFCERCRFALF